MRQAIRSLDKRRLSTSSRVRCRRGTHPLRRALGRQKLQPHLAYLEARRVLQARGQAQGRGPRRPPQGRRAGRITRGSSQDRIDHGGTASRAARPPMQMARDLVMDTYPPPLVPRDLPRDHPLITMDYSLFTPPHPAHGRVPWQVGSTTRVNGAVIYRTVAIWQSPVPSNHWLQSLLADRYGGYVPLVISSHTAESVNQSVRTFYVHLLRSQRAPAGTGRAWCPGPARDAGAALDNWRPREAGASWCWSSTRPRA